MPGAGRAAARPRPGRPGGLTIVLLLALAWAAPIASGETLLRTAVVDAEGWDPELLQSGRHRQLLGASDCRDGRWGPLCGRVQLLVQLAEGHDPEDARKLLAALRGDGALISSSLPTDTWLVVARPDDLTSPVYRQHKLLPFAPEYKLSPDWHDVLELVHREHEQRVGSGRPDAAAQHLQLHQLVVDHSLVQQLQLHTAAQHLRKAAAAHAEAAGGLDGSAASKLLIGVHFPDLLQPELRRAGVDPAGDAFSPAAAAAADWAEPLAALVAADDGRSWHHRVLCVPELLPHGKYALDVAVCPQDLSNVLHWLSNQAAVHWLAPRPRLLLQNAVASMIVQDNNAVAASSDYTKPESHPFWEAGLDGKGQVIGIGDSGIDMDSCYFHDPMVPFTPSGGEWSNPEHRKVVLYWGLADDRYRDLVGHGTHTSGSLAGFDPMQPESKATGAAKSAKLAFADLSRFAGGDVNAPQDVETDYYPRMYRAGARIFSDSWGSSSPIYDYQSSRVDSWLFHNQDCVCHFAAGNYGENDNLDTTITSPATAKNVVTVGATKSMTPNYISQTIAPVFTMSIKILRADKADQYVSMRLVKADFGGDGSSLSSQGLPVVQADPPDACTPLVGADTGKYRGALVLARRGQCYFSVKMDSGLSAGAAAVLVINNAPGGFFKMDSQDGVGAERSPMTLFALPRRMGEELWSYFNSSDSIRATIERYAGNWEAFEDIAAFSSFGPASDGRIKPDIVGPGELVSASAADSEAGSSQPSCSVGRKSGTSMATPLVAGHAAIVRQYFMDGFYPSGAGRAADAHVPSGPLVKAVMMGGACDMKGNTEQYLPLEDSPSMRQGFGRLCLCSSLKLAGKCNTNVQVVDRVPLSSGESHRYCLRSTGGDVRVMLVWYDVPASMAAVSTLINDLDLVVRSGGMGGQAFFGNMGQQPDSVNTAERVWLKNVPAGGLDITVSARTLSPATPSQNYSLVVQGAFTNVLASPYNPDVTAHAATPGGCTELQMMSVRTRHRKRAAPEAPAAAASLAAAAVSTAPEEVQQEAAPAPAGDQAPDQAAAAASPSPEPAAGVASPSPEPEPSSEPAAGVASPSPEPEPSPEPSPEPVPPADAASPVPGPQDVASPSPAPADTATPPSSPAPGDGLLGMLLGAMTAPGAEGSEGAPPQGRRLTWLPPTPPALKVSLPAVVCRWVPNARADPLTGRATLTVTLHGMAGGCALALAACCLLAGLSLRRYSLCRSASLTSAISHDLSLNKAKARAAGGGGGAATVTAQDALREALARGSRVDNGGRGAAASAGLFSRARSTSSNSGGSAGAAAAGAGADDDTSSVISIGADGENNGGTGSSSSSEPGTPKSPRAAPANLVASSGAGTLPSSASCPMHAWPTPAVATAPAAAVGATAPQQCQVAPVYARSRSFSQHGSNVPRGAAAPPSTALESAAPAMLHGSRSFSTGMVGRQPPPQPLSWAHRAHSSGCTPDDAAIVEGPRGGGCLGAPWVPSPAPGGVPLAGVPCAAPAEAPAAKHPASFGAARSLGEVQGKRAPQPLDDAMLRDQEGALPSS